MVGAEMIFGTGTGNYVGASGRLLYFRTTAAPTAKALRLHLFGEAIVETELEEFGGMRLLSQEDIGEMTYTSKCSYKTPKKDKKSFFFWRGKRGCEACVGSYTTLWYGRKGKEAGNYPCRWWAASGSKGRCSVWQRGPTAHYGVANGEWAQDDARKVVLEQQYCPERSRHYTPPKSPDGHNGHGTHH